MASGAACDNCGKRAVSFCEDCPGLLCTPCLSDHQLTTAFSSHRLLDLSSRAGQQGHVLRYVLCPDHHRHLTYYCHDCGRGLCRQCVPRGHAGHRAEQLTTLLPARRVLLEQTLKTIRCMTKELHTKNDGPRTIQEEAESTLEQAEGEFKHHLEHIQTTLKDWEEKTRKDFDNRRFSLVRDVDKVLNDRTGYMYRMKQLEEEADRLLTPNSRPLEVVEKADELVKNLELLKLDAVKTQNKMFLKGAKYVPKAEEPAVGYIKDVAIGVRPDARKPSFWTSSSRGGAVGELLAPCDVLLLPDGRLLLADWGNGRVQLFSSCGDTSSVLLQDLTPQRLAATPEGVLLVSDDKSRTVVSFTCNGQVVREWKPPEVVRPWGVAVTRDSSWVVTDYAESKGLIYTADGLVKDRFGGYGYLEDWMLNLPGYVCCDLHGRILISDCNRHSVKIFDSCGRFISSFSKRGTQEGQLRYPRGVCVDNANNIIVADWGNDRISQFSPDGQFISHVFPKDNTGPFGWPCGLSYLSGTFNDGKARLAITSENPDGLCVVPYHIQAQNSQLLSESANGEQLPKDQIQDTNYAIEATENGIIVWEKESGEDVLDGASIKDKKKRNSSPGPPRQQSNRRRVSHGSRSGQSRSSSQETPSPNQLSTGPVKRNGFNSESSNSPRASVASVAQSSGGGHSERCSASGSSPASGLGLLENGDGSLNFLNSTYIPSTGAPRNKRRTKLHSKSNEQKHVGRSPRESMNEVSLESIPERFSFSTEGDG